MKRYTCPCCGYRVFRDAPGSQELCPICGWRDDLNHLRFVLFNGLPNGISLAQAQQNFMALGAKDAESLGNVRFATEDDERDPDWRPFDSELDEAEAVPNDYVGLSTPDDPTALYYWLPDYRDKRFISDA